jgi:hypothetical protein
MCLGGGHPTTLTWTPENLRRGTRDRLGMGRGHSFSGIPRGLQKFTEFDDEDSITLRRCTHPLSKDYCNLVGETFRVLERAPKRIRILHWRYGRDPPVNIRTAKRGSGYLSRWLCKADIHNIGTYQPEREDGPKIKLQPQCVGICSPRFCQNEPPYRKEMRALMLNDPSPFLATANTFRQLE